jgi:hypothetical protein
VKKEEEEITQALNKRQNITKILVHEFKTETLGKTLCNWLTIKKKNPAKTDYFKRTVSVPATEDLNVCSWQKAAPRF